MVADRSLRMSHESYTFVSVVLRTPNVHGGLRTATGTCHSCSAENNSSHVCLPVCATVDFEEQGRIEQESAPLCLELPLPRIEAFSLSSGMPDQLGRNGISSPTRP